MGGQNPHKLQKVEISEDLGIQENLSKTTSEELLKIRGKKSIFYLWPSDKVSQETVLHTSRISKLFFFFSLFCTQVSNRIPFNLGYKHTFNPLNFHSQLMSDLASSGQSNP